MSSTPNVGTVPPARCSSVWLSPTLTAPNGVFSSAQPMSSMRYSTSKPSASRYHATDRSRSDTLTEIVRFAGSYSIAEPVVSVAACWDISPPSVASVCTSFYTSTTSVSSPSLFHFRWSLPVLAELHRNGGAKFVTLSQRLGVGRETLRRTLDSLVDAGLVARNPGY